MKKTQKKKKNLLGKINFGSRKTQIIAVALIFASIGSYFVFSSFAITTDPHITTVTPKCSNISIFPNGKTDTNVNCQRSADGDKSNIPTVDISRTSSSSSVAGQAIRDGDGYWWVFYDTQYRLCLNMRSLTSSGSSVLIDVVDFNKPYNINFNIKTLVSATTTNSKKCTNWKQLSNEFQLDTSTNRLKMYEPGVPTATAYSGKTRIISFVFESRQIPKTSTTEPTK